MDRGRAIRLLALALPLLTIAALWAFTDLGLYRSPSEVAQALRVVGEQPLGVFYVPVGFALATVVFIPVTALILGTTLAFEPLRGFVFSMAGGLLGASMAYGAGRLLGGTIVDGFGGKRFAQFTGQLRTHAFRSSLILHLLPFGNFTAVNLLAGSLRVPFGGFLVGTALGLLPGVVFLTFLKGHLPDVLRDPSLVNLTLLGAGVVLAIGLGWLLRRWAKRREHGAPTT